MSRAAHPGRRATAEFPPRGPVPATPVANRPRPRRPIHRAVPDAVAIAALLALFPVVHDLPTALRLPYWHDEAWVALSTVHRGDLLQVSSSTPVGWTLLLRLVPDGDYLRVVPLFFLALSVVAAYGFGRLALGAGHAIGIVAGLVCGGAALLLPAEQVRHDLKQYTADAAMTLVLFTLSAWVERGWRAHGGGRRRLVALTAVAGTTMLVSNAAALAGVCVFAGLSGAALALRRWRRVVEVAVAGAIAATLMAAIYVGLAAQNRSPALRQYWADYFPKLDALWSYLQYRLDYLAPFIGASDVLVLVLVVVGAVALLRAGHGGTAIAVVLLPVIVVVLGLAKVYPLLDLRTSHFLLVALTTFGALGVVAIAVELARQTRRLDNRASVALLTTVLCAATVGAYSWHNRQWYRLRGDAASFQITPMATEDVRFPTAYVWAHRQPGDLVLVNYGARYGFAFYWGRGPVALVPVPDTVGWTVALPDQPEIAFAPDRTAASIRQTLDDLVVRTGSGPSTPIWVIRSHIGAPEYTEWNAALVGYDIETITGGGEPLLRITRSGSAGPAFGDLVSARGGA